MTPIHNNCFYIAFISRHWSLIMAIWSEMWECFYDIARDVCSPVSSAQWKADCSPERVESVKGKGGCKWHCLLLFLLKLYSYFCNKGVK